MRVGVVGGGVAGMVAAACLKRASHTVTLFEAGARLGGLARAIAYGGHTFCPGPQYVWGFGPGEPGAAIAAKLGLDLHWHTLPEDFDHVGVGAGPWTALRFGRPLVDGASGSPRDAGEARAVDAFVDVMEALGGAAPVLGAGARFRLPAREMMGAVLRGRGVSARDKATIFRFRNASVSDVARHVKLPPRLLRVLAYTQHFFAERLDELSAVLFAAARYHFTRTLRVPQDGVAALIDALERSVVRAGVEVLTQSPISGVSATSSGWDLHVGTRAFACDHVVWSCSPATVAALMPSLRGRFEPGHPVGCICVDAELDEAARAALLRRNFSWYADDGDVDFARPGTELRALNFTSPSMNGGATGSRQVICAFFPSAADDEGAAAQAALHRLTTAISASGAIRVESVLTLSPRTWSRHFGAVSGASYARRLSAVGMRHQALGRLPPRMSVAHAGAGIPGLLACFQMGDAVVDEVPA